MSRAAVRRSARGASNASNSYKETTDSESEEVSDYEEPPIKKRIVSRSLAKGTAKAKPATRTAKGNKRVNLEQLEANLPENHLFHSLAQPELDTLDLALEWIDAYIEDLESESHDSITSLINLILRSCGSVYLFEQHDLVNLESAAETVDEITIAFGSQQSHKYPFKALPTFKKNVFGFFESLISISHEKGLLYKYSNSDEEEEEEEEKSEYLSSPLMTHIITWISSLSSCTIRPLRYIATSILLTIQNQLCHTINSVANNLNKSQRQLSKIPKKNKLKFQNLLDTVRSYQNQKDTILEYFSEIENITLGHRYRDIDPIIRQECVRFLGLAMTIYPDHFFQTTFLRYFGWLLSDSAHVVRLEVTKVLLKLYKNSTGNSGRSTNLSIGFRQFTERYKEQIIKMNKVDPDVNVQFSTISICCELLKIGFLNENESYEVISIFSDLVNGNKSLSKTNLQKFKMEIGKFISILNNANLKNKLEKYSIFIENYHSSLFGGSDDESEGKLQIKTVLKIKDLMDLLKNSMNYQLENLSTKLDKFQIQSYCISQIYQTLYQSPSYEGTWGFLVRYLLLDSYSVTFTPKDQDLDEDNVEVQEFKEMLDISNDDDRVYLLSFINGSISSLLASKPQDLSPILIKLVNYLPSIQSILMKSPNLVKVFISIWNQLIRIEDESTNIFSIFKEMGQINVYNDITTMLLKDYQSYQGVDDSAEYNKFFSRLLIHYDSATITGLNIITSEIKLQVQNLVEELIAEAKELLADDEEDLPEIENLDNDLRIQKKLIGNVIEIFPTLTKLHTLGDHIDINPFLSSISSSLLELVQVKICGLFNIEVIIEKWSNNFLLVNSKFIEGFKAILDLFLIATSWKLEKIIYIEDLEAQEGYDIVKIFKDVDVLLQSIHRSVIGFDNVINSILENDLKSKFLLVKTIEDLATLFSAKFIDLITSIKIFYVKVKDNNNFSNFNRYFNDEESFGYNYITKGISREVQTQFLKLFLYKEAQLAKVLGVELDRTDEEDVNIEELVSDNTIEIEMSDTEITQASEFNSDIEEEDEGGDIDGDHENNQAEILENQRRRKLELKQLHAKQKRTWVYEKELCVYTLKLLALIDISMTDEEIIGRIKLNQSKLGGVFSRIIQQYELKANSVTGNSNLTNQQNETTKETGGIEFEASNRLEIGDLETAST